MAHRPALAEFPAGRDRSLAGSVVYAALILAQGRSSRLRGYLLLGGYAVVVVAFFVAGDRA
jgi:Ca2+/H+ antiporter